MEVVFNPDYEYVTVSEVAKVCRYSKRSVYRRMQDGTLDAVKVGGAWLITKKSLDKMLGKLAKQAEVK